jgi:tellurite resistance protein
VRHFAPISSIEYLSRPSLQWLAATSFVSTQFHRQPTSTCAMVLAQEPERDGDKPMTEVHKLQNTEVVQAALAQTAAYQEMLQREAAIKEQILAQQAMEAGNNNSQVGALVEAIYLVATADGRFSGEECAELSAHVAALTDNRFSAEDVETMRHAAEGRAGEGIEARGHAIAELLSDADLRRSALLAASAVAWQDGGVGTKEGLALQSLARAFGIPINELHKIMSEAHG